MKRDDPGIRDAKEIGNRQSDRVSECQGGSDGIHWDGRRAKGCFRLTAGCLFGDVGRRYRDSRGKSQECRRHHGD